jgi:predicted amidohydrolase YtcJ
MTIGPVGSLLVREVRLVPIAGIAAPARPVDVRIDAGVVTEVGAALPARSDAQTIDAAGRWAIPGLWDHHVHLGLWSVTRSQIDLSGTTCAEDALDRVRAHLATLPDDDRELVQGFGHRSAMWPTPPTVAALDAAGGSRPVVLVSGDVHQGWLNSAALDLLGAPRVSGALDEDDWFPVYGRFLEARSRGPQALAAYQAAVADAHAKGIVGIGDMDFERTWARWPDRSVSTLRARAAVYADDLDEVIDAGLRSGDPLGGLAVMGPLKIISDGSLNTRTAHCLTPFADAGDSAHPRGKQNVSPEDLRDLLDRATRNGLDIAVHAIGDAALRIAVDAVESTGAHGSIEHVQLAQPAEVLRMARLGLRASVQPAHLLDDRDATTVCWPDRTHRCFVFKEMLDHGVPLAFGSDAPVSPLDPWLTMAAAVHRSADERRPWSPEQALTVAEALAASTDGQSTVAVGSRGDLVLLDADPLAGPSDSAGAAAYLRSMPVAATIVAGRPVFDADQVCQG